MPANHGDASDAMPPGNMVFRQNLIFSTTFVLWVLALFGVLEVPTVAAENRRPNIIFLLADDQRWDTLGCMGNSIIQTPNVDRLAEEGVVFDHCFVTTSICMTNRACIFTGQYAARHGVVDFRTNFTAEQLAQTYPGRLKEAGYYLGFIGKWGVGQPPKELFDYNKGWPGQNRYLNVEEGKFRHLTSIMSDQAIEFLDSTPADKPFCLSFSFKAPHVQDGPPSRFLDDPRFKGRYDRHPSQFFYDPQFASLYRDAVIPRPALSDPAFFDALPEFLRTSENRVRWEIRFATPEMHQESVKAYYRLITGVDRVVGRIVEKLKAKGQFDNTVILYTGDNGFYLGERGFAGKWFPHEPSIRVPLVVYDPRLPQPQRGTRRDQMVLSIDLAPTMLAMAGVKIPEGMQGESLTPLIAGETPEWRSEFFYEHLFEHARIPRTEAVRDQRYKFIRYLDAEPMYEELYDLENDPLEAHNLADSVSPVHAAALERMRQKWESWRERAK
ncbi:MAG: sulfatase [Planctomycetota bacterium]